MLINQYKMGKEVNDLLKFAKKLVGIKYTWWTGHEKKEDDFFYVNCIPKFKTLQNRGIGCTGLINILRQSVGKPIPPSNSLFRGGTVFWYKYLKSKKLLKPFDYTKNYPLGTLFLRKYRNIDDQGHVAIYYKKNKKDPTKLLYGEIIHAYADDKHPAGGQVGTTILGYSHFYGGGRTGYYEYVITPTNWLN